MSIVSSGAESRYESLIEFPNVITVPVLWGDLDALGHVNNLIYLRWCETARIYYLEQVGLLDLMKEEQVGPIMAAVGCNYRRPVEFPDTVHIGSRVTRIGNSSFQMEHRIVSEAFASVVADSDSTLVVYDYVRRTPAPMPARIRKAIEQLEAGSAATAGEVGGR